MKTLFVIILITMMSMGLSAQRISDLPKSQQPQAATKAQPSQTPQAASQDSIIFDKLQHDYGTIVQGGDGNCVFKFTNKGEKPLILSNVRSSCGCTVPQWPREPIAPGEKGEIKVKYDTKRLGSFNKSITINSNAANSVVRLLIKGKVDAK